MANKMHVETLRAGVKEWNAWRKSSSFEPDLREADLIGCDLVGANLVGATLYEAQLQEADLRNANLFGANVIQAQFLATKLDGANFQEADLSGANLIYASALRASFNSADLNFTRLHMANLSGADFTHARLGDAILYNLDLSSVIGLEECIHDGPSALDYSTIERSGLLPTSFLRGVGLPEALIEYLPSLLNQPIRHYSCFISYASRDQEFADRLHADLQGNGARCWFAPHDMPIGAKIWDEIGAAIRLRDKVLLILSERSIKSDWVEDEVTKAFEEERKRGQTVLFPVRLDDAVMDTSEPWAAKLRARHIGDFRRWKEHDEYQKRFARVLRDLKVKKE
jgi:uncharacterized protein YjbI with pentapeptide repeats